MFEESYMKIYKKRKERRKSEQIKRKKEKKERISKTLVKDIFEILLFLFLYILAFTHTLKHRPDLAPMHSLQEYIPQLIQQLWIQDLLLEFLLC